MCEPGSLAAIGSALGIGTGTAAPAGAAAAGLTAFEKGMLGLTLATTVTTVGTQAANAVAQQKAADEQGDAIKASAIAQGSALARRSVQESVASDLKKTEATDRAREAIATATVSGLEGGVGGAGSRVVSTIARDIRRQRLANITAIERNDDATQEQLGDEIVGVTGRGNRSLSGVNPGSGVGLSVGPALIQGAGTGLALGNAYSRFRNPRVR